MAKRTLALVLGALLAAPLAVGTLPAQAGTTRYNPRRAGHPLRMIAYAVHPVGVALDYMIFRPAWWLGTHEPLRTIFGVQVMFDDSAEVARAMQERFDKSAPAPAPAPPQPPPADEAPQPAPPPDSSD